MRRALLSLLLLVGVHAAAGAQSLDVPEQPTFDDKLPRKKSGCGAAEQEFQIKGALEFEKSNLALCSEGAASGEDLENALIACDAAIADRPDSGDAHYYRGFVLYLLERYEAAEGSFTQAIDFPSGRLAESYYQRGVCKEAQRRLRDAASDFRRAHELKPEWSAARRKVDEYQWALD